MHDNGRMCVQLCMWHTKEVLLLMCLMVECLSVSVDVYLRLVSLNQHYSCNYEWRWQKEWSVPSVAYYSKQLASTFQVSPLKPTPQLSDPGQGYCGFNHRFHTCKQREYSILPASYQWLTS